MNIKEQIETLNLPEDIKSRILELTMKAGVYDIFRHTSEFRLNQAFMWKDTHEGEEFWYRIFMSIEGHKQGLKGFDVL